MLSLHIILLYSNSDTANGAKVILSESNLLLRSESCNTAICSCIVAQQSLGGSDKTRAAEIKILWYLLPMHDIIIVPYSENWKLRK